MTRVLLYAGHVDLDEDDTRTLIRALIEELGEQDERIDSLEYRLSNIQARLGQPSTALTTITDTERNPITMATQIHDNDHSKTITVVAGSYQDALGVPITPDPAGLTPTWSSSNTAVATVDPASGAIAPVLPVTPGAVTTISGTATNPDGSTVAYQPQDIEVIAGPPATVNTQIA